MGDMVRVPMPSSFDSVILKAIPDPSVKNVLPKVSQPLDMKIRRVKVTRLVPAYPVVRGCK